MSDIHLESRYVQELIRLLQAFPAIEKASVFGSRALGTEKRGSDVDVVLYGSIDERLLGQVRNALEESSMPYFFDVIAYDAVTHAALIQHIDTYARVIYAKAKQTAV